LHGNRFIVRTGSGDSVVRVNGDMDEAHPAGRLEEPRVPDNGEQVPLSRGCRGEFSGKIAG